MKPLVFVESAVANTGEKPVAQKDDTEAKE